MQSAGGVLQRPDHFKMHELRSFKCFEDNTFLTVKHFYESYIVIFHNLPRLTPGGLHIAQAKQTQQIRTEKKSVRIYKQRNNRKTEKE